VSNQSIRALDQAVCEGLNNEFQANYKLFIENMVITFVTFYAFLTGRKKVGVERKKIVVVATALILFFATFSVTEYMASMTGFYEINLYSLFILPIFLFMIVYAISDLEIFHIRLLGFQLIPYVLVIMIGSQFFFLENSTYKLLTVITLILSFGFSWLFLRSGKREIEAHKKVEALADELEQANLQLRELDRQKDELLSIVSHQLATPVSSVKWYIEMMLDGDLGKVYDEQRQHLTSVQHVCSELTDLVSMILDVSRIQLGRVKVEKQELDLAAFFKEILEIIEPKAKEKGTHFVVNIPSSFPKAMLDKRYTKMTVENLLSNAVKYTPKDGSVEFNVTLNGNMLGCSVKDTGCGIPKADQSQIFGKMFRASNVRNEVDGNGFGLYIAKGAIEAQGGKIWFESTEGKGTTFSLILPLQ